MLKTSFRMVWRNALKNRSYTFISLLSLVLGITLFFLISIWIKDEMGYDKHFPEAREICRVESTLIEPGGAVSNTSSVGWPIGKILSTKYPEIDHVTYLRNWQPNILHKGAHFYEHGLYADKEFFNVFGYALAEGNPANALTDPYSVVISKDLRQKYFGNEQALGKIIMINDTIPYKITGVFNDLSAPSHLSFDMIGSFTTICSMSPEYCEREFAQGWFDLNVYNYVRLNKNADARVVESRIRDIVLTNGKDEIKKTGYKSILSLRPVTDIYLYSGMQTAGGTIGNYKTMRLFLLIGIFILVIACLNFINLTTANSVERAKEIGVKKVLGGDRRGLIIQFLTEAGILCGFATLVSVVLMVLLLPSFNQFTGKTFTIASMFSPGNILLLAGILIVLVPLAGLYPSWVLSSFKPIKVLKGKFAHTNSGNFLRRSLVVTQFTISAAFIMCTIIMWKQMRFMQQKELGFDKEKLLVVDMAKVPWGMRHDKGPLFKQNLLAQQGIKNVSLANSVPGRSGWDGQFAYPEGKTTEQGLTVEYIPVDMDFIRTIGLQLTSGRDFIANSKQDEDESFIINEAAVKMFGWPDAQKAIGMKLSTSGKEGRVVGVIKDYHQHGLQRKINPIVLSPVKYINVAALRYEGISPEQAVATVTTNWAKVFNGYPVEYKFLDDDFQQQYQKEEKLKDFFSVAAALSIVIACLGLLGLSLYTAQKRIKEIGIRKILGASVNGIVVLVSKELLKMVGLAILIAIPIAFWSMNKWLEDFAYRTSMSWWIFVLAGAAALVIAVITISFQAIRAALTNPVKSLRAE